MGVSPLIDACGCFCIKVHSIQNIFTDFPNIGFGRVDQSETRSVFKIRFVVFNSDVRISFLETFNTLIDAQFLDNFEGSFIYFINENIKFSILIT